MEAQKQSPTAVLERWIEALRSGEYEQTRSALRHGDKFCCLGVLCDLWRKETGKGTWSGIEGATIGEQQFVTDFNTGQYTHWYYLVEPVLEWLNIGVFAGLMDKREAPFRLHLIRDGEARKEVEEICQKYGLKREHRHTLARLNDKGATFEEIARVIELAILPLARRLEQRQKEAGEAPTF